jgi:hypothetical protein
LDGEKNGGRLFRRPKLTPSCSADRKEGRKEGKYISNLLDFLNLNLKLTKRKRSA